MKNLLILVTILALMSVNFSYAERFRTFTPGDLSMAKPIAKKQNGAFCEFRFANSNTASVNALYIEFNADAEIEFVSQFTTADLLQMNGKVWKLSGSDIQSLSNVIVRVSTSKKAVKVTRWWWLQNTERVGAVQGKLEANYTAAKLPMPNTANVREEVFAQKGLALIVGTPRPDKKKELAWVELRTSTDILKSLFDKEDFHFGQPRGLSRLSNGMTMKGAYKKLTPSMQNNRLFANLVALKFNLLISDMAITPSGFGELVYNDATSPYYGKSVREIALHADSMMTNWLGVLRADYNAIDDVVSRINNSFRGPLDTVTYSKKLCLTGVEGNGSTVLVSAQSGRTVTAETNFDANVPSASELKQNYPNPFNPTTKITFTLGVKSNVTLKVYNMLGQEVSALLNNELVDEGTREVVFTGDNLSSGTYIYRISAENKEMGYSFEKTMRMTLLK